MNPEKQKLQDARDRREDHRTYRAGHLPQIRERIAQKCRVDAQFKLSRNLRSRLSIALRGEFKMGSAVRDLGCSISELKLHLESKFHPGMTWENYGEWHIDHIKPLAKFNLTDRSQLLEACNYKNLQPLWAMENLQKGARP